MSPSRGCSIRSDPGVRSPHLLPQHMGWGGDPQCISQPGARGTSAECLGVSGHGRSPGRCAVCEQSLSVTHGCAKGSAFNYSAEERLNRRSHQRATRGVVAMEMSFRASSSSDGSMISVGLGRSGGSCCLAPSHSPNTAQGKVLQCRAGSSSYRGAALPRASTEPCARRWGSAALLGPVLPRFCAPSAPSTAITLLGFFCFLLLSCAWCGWGKS